MILAYSLSRRGEAYGRCADGPLRHYTDSDGGLRSSTVNGHLNAHDSLLHYEKDIVYTDHPLLVGM